jgi:hypothetical protein
MCTPEIVKDLIKAFPRKHKNDQVLRVEWIFEDDDYEAVTGPDGKDGWFNSSTDNGKVKHIDVKIVRAFIDQVLGSKYFPEDASLSEGDIFVTAYIDKSREGDDQEISDLINSHIA